MINSIIEAIGISLDEEFNSEAGKIYAIYKNADKQGLEEPCFFISCTNCAQKLFFNRKYFREHTFRIQYLPGNGQNKEECSAVMERLFYCLEWLTVTDSPVMGTKMRGEIVDGVLNFFVNYDMYVYYERTENPPMENLQHATLTKGTGEQDG